jgi:hypothetical protein
MAQQVSAWLSKFQHGSAGLRMTCMAQFDSTWLSMAQHDSAWLTMTQHVDYFNFSLQNAFLLIVAK